MEVRGERRCTDCDTEWSYYETGRVTCPNCGSLRSVGVSERVLHTHRSPSLDLDAAREAASHGRIRAAAEAAQDSAATHIREHGFIDQGNLRELSDAVLAVYELREVGRTIGRTLDVGERQQHYFTELLVGVPDGERPDPAEVPAPLHAARGLAVAAAVDEYLSEVSTWLDRRDDPPVSAVTTVLGRIRDHRRRIAALDGDVDPADAERLVTAVRATVTYIQAEEPSALDRAREALDAIH